MRTGRNDPCPCGSGKKYKKCCLLLDELQQAAMGPPEPPSPPLPVNLGAILQLKGKKAEEVVTQLAGKTFLVDWCFPNPHLPDGKELCDLLVVFDSVAIICQVKDLKLDKDGKYKQGEVEKNLRQVVGAKRQLIDLKTPVELTNAKRKKVAFDPASIKEVYLLSILMGEGESFFSFMEEFKKHTIHVFTREFTAIVMKELDTITDFCNYLRAKEAFVKAKDMMMINGGEEELLGYYLLNQRSFESLREPNGVMIDQGFWEDVQRRPEFKAKKEADKISYGWDFMIGRAHEGGSAEYEMIAREMAKLSRFERRALAQAFYNAHTRAHHITDGRHFRRVIVGNGITYGFLFDDRASREQRATILKHLAFVARGQYPQNKKVLAIATEQKIRRECTYDFLLLIKEEWTAEDQKDYEEVQKVTGLLTNITMTPTHDEEYPASAPPSSPGSAKS